MVIVWNANVVFNCNGLDCIRYTGGFDPVAEFLPAGLSLAVFSVLACCLGCPFGLVTAVKSQGGCSFGSL